jgi:putative chitinase
MGIDAIISAAKEQKLSLRDTAHLLAIARHESGFNPYAAAGPSSASGIGQFIEATGQMYGLTNVTRWNIDAQAHALVRVFKDYQVKVRDNNLSESYVYKYHYDGLNSKVDKGKGLAIGKKDVYPQIEPISKAIENIF